MRFALALLICLSACEDEDENADMSIDLAGYDGPACQPSNSVYATCLASFCCDPRCKGASDGAACTTVGVNCQFSETVFINCESDFKWHKHVFTPITHDGGHD